MKRRELSCRNEPLGPQESVTPPQHTTIALRSKWSELYALRLTIIPPAGTVQWEGPRRPQRVSLMPREELDAMIGRAEAACLRYRRAAEEWGLSPVVRQSRRAKLEIMETMLARLREERALKRA